MDSVTFSINKRSRQPEYMDEANLKGAEMQQILKDLRFVNTFLGGTKITVEGIEKLLKNKDKSINYTILDIGCGDGEMLRRCADFAAKNDYNFNLIGLDFNPQIIEYAASISTNFKNISFKSVDVFSEEFKTLNVDICLCTLFLHHFEDEKIVKLVSRLYENVKIGVIVNDLNRNPISFFTFKFIRHLILKNKIARHDGLVSVARSFRKKELQSYAAKIKATHQTIKWKWAFRYQWILKKA